MSVPFDRVIFEATGVRRDSFVSAEMSNFLQTGALTPRRNRFGGTTERRGTSLKSQRILLDMAAAMARSNDRVMRRHRSNASTLWRWQDAIDLDVGHFRSKQLLLETHLSHGMTTTEQARLPTALRVAISLETLWNILILHCPQHTLPQAELATRELMRAIYVNYDDLQSIARPLRNDILLSLGTAYFETVQRLQDDVSTVTIRAAKLENQLRTRVGATQKGRFLLELSQTRARHTLLRLLMRSWHSIARGKRLMRRRHMRTRLRIWFNGLRMRIFIGKLYRYIATFGNHLRSVRELLDCALAEVSPDKAVHIRRELEEGGMGSLGDVIPENDFEALALYLRRQHRIPKSSGNEKPSVMGQSQMVGQQQTRDVAGQEQTQTQTHDVDNGTDDGSAPQEIINRADVSIQTDGDWSVECPKCHCVIMIEGSAFAAAPTIIGLSSSSNVEHQAVPQTSAGGPGQQGKEPTMGAQDGFARQEIARLRGSTDHQQDEEQINLRTGQVMYAYEGGGGVDDPERRVTDFERTGSVSTQEGPEESVFIAATAAAAAAETSMPEAASSIRSGLDLPLDAIQSPRAGPPTDRQDMSSPQSTARRPQGVPELSRRFTSSARTLTGLTSARRRSSTRAGTLSNLMASTGGSDAKSPPPQDEQDGTREGQSPWLNNDNLNECLTDFSDSDIEGGFFNSGESLERGVEVPEAWMAIIRTDKQSLKKRLKGTRVASPQTLAQALLQVYDAASRDKTSFAGDSTSAAAGLADFTLSWLMANYGSGRVFTKRLETLLASVIQHAPNDPWVNLFARFTGILPPSLPVEALKFFLNALLALRLHQQKAHVPGRVVPPGVLLPVQYRHALAVMNASCKVFISDLSAARRTLEAARIKSPSPFHEVDARVVLCTMMDLWQEDVKLLGVALGRVLAPPPETPHLNALCDAKTFVKAFLEAGFVTHQAPPAETLSQLFDEASRRGTNRPPPTGAQSPVTLESVVITLQSSFPLLRRLLDFKALGQPSRTDKWNISVATYRVSKHLLAWAHKRRCRKKAMQILLRWFTSRLARWKTMIRQRAEATATIHEEEEEEEDEDGQEVKEEEKEGKGEEGEPISA